MVNYKLKKNLKLNFPQFDKYFWNYTANDIEIIVFAHLPGREIARSGNFSHGGWKTSLHIARPGREFQSWVGKLHLIAARGYGHASPQARFYWFFIKRTFTVLHSGQDERFRYFLNLLQQYFVRLIFPVYSIPVNFTQGGFHWFFINGLSQIR